MRFSHSFQKRCQICTSNNLLPHTFQFVMDAVDINTLAQQYKNPYAVNKQETDWYVQSKWTPHWQNFKELSNINEKEVEMKDMRDVGSVKEP